MVGERLERHVVGVFAAAAVDGHRRPRSIVTIGEQRAFDLYRAPVGGNGPHPELNLIVAINPAVETIARASDCQPDERDREGARDSAAIAPNARHARKLAGLRP